MRWAARISGLLLAIVVGAFLLGNTEYLSAPNTSEAIQMAFFLVMAAGWLIGWFREDAGGWMTVLGWVGFQVLEWSSSGGPVLQPQFLAMLLPGVLFLVAATRSSGPSARAG